MRLAAADLFRDEVKPHGRAVQVIHGETKGSVESLEGVAVRLVKVNRSVALYGGQSLTEVESIEAGRTSVPLLTPANISSRQIGETTFVIGLSPAAIGSALAQFTNEQTPVPEVAILADRRNPNAQDTVEAFERELLAKGRKVKASMPFGKDDKMKDLADRVGKLKVDAVLFIGDSVDFLEQSKACAEHRPLFLFGGADGSLSSGEVAGSVIVATAFTVDAALPKTVEFAKKYQDAFKREADVHAALAYEGTRILVESLQNVGQGENLVDELKKVKDFSGLTGALSFESDRTLRRPALLVRIEGAKRTLIKQVAP